MAGSIDVVAVAGSTLSAAEVIAEGQLQLGYIPNCTTDAALDAFILSRISDADDYVQLYVGTNYTSADARVLRQIKRAVLYLTIGHIWQVIKNVMDGYDAEALPPEFVNPDQAAANRDFYLGQGEALLQRYEQQADPAATIDDAILCSSTGTSKEFQMARYDGDGNIISGSEGTMGVF